jgi:hypothetical protein
MQCSRENPQGVLSSEIGSKRRHDMLHAMSGIGFRTAVEESLDLADLQSVQTVRILIKSKELQKASEPARVDGDRAHYQSADTV